MKIEKVENDIFKTSADNKRAEAKKIIKQCLELGAGVYEVKDDENIFTNKERMIIYLTTASRWNGNQRITNVEIKSKNSKEHIYVIVK